MPLLTHLSVLCFVQCLYPPPNKYISPSMYAPTVIHILSDFSHQIINDISTLIPWFTFAPTFHTKLLTTQCVKLPKSDTWPVVTKKSTSSGPAAILRNVQALHIATTIRPDIARDAKHIGKQSVRRSHPEYFLSTRSTADGVAAMDGFLTPKEY